MRKRQQPYEDVVITCPATVDYVRYSNRSAHWFLAKSLKAVIDAAGIALNDVDGLCVSSFQLVPDTAVGLTQHLGVSPRWLDHLPMGGACGVAALRRGLRAATLRPAHVRNAEHADVVPP